MRTNLFNIILLLIEVLQTVYYQHKALQEKSYLKNVVFNNLKLFTILR